MNPPVVAHADWSVDAKKRWVAVATWSAARRRYIVEPPRNVGKADRLPVELAARGLPVLLGLDFPIGLPRDYAARARIEGFRAFLGRLGNGELGRFFDVAARAGEIALDRPFYPRGAAKKGAVARDDLVRGLGLGSGAALHRLCDRATANRPAGSPLFWTLGAKQVGKAAASGWRDLILSGLARGAPEMALWPFDGTLGRLLRQRAVVLAEAYPAEYYRHLGVDFGRGSKRDWRARRAQAPALLAAARALALSLTGGLRQEIRDGFAGTPRAGENVGEDRFDCVVGLLGVLRVVRGMQPEGLPRDPAVRRVEGWILGQRDLPV